MVPATFEGKPCRHGHGTTRYTKSRRCVVCRRNQANAEYAADPERIRYRANAWRKENPERLFLILELPFPEPF